jgi:hypothetical protein
VPCVCFIVSIEVASHGVNRPFGFGLETGSAFFPASVPVPFCFFLFFVLKGGFRGTSGLPKDHTEWKRMSIWDYCIEDG